LCSTIPPISKKEKSPLNSDGHTFHQYQQSKQSPLNSDGHTFHQYQQSKQSPLNNDGQQFNQYQQSKQSPLNSIGGIVEHHCLEDIVSFVDITKQTITSKQ
jgi:uncharacterized protein YifE (UPF0438 family)